MSWVRAHKTLFAALGAGVVVVAGGLVGGAYAYDASKADVIADGVHVGSVDVGGLTPQQARRRVARYYRPLRRPLVLRAGRRHFVLRPRRVGLRLPVAAAVAEALRRSRDGWFVSRAVRELSGGTVNARLRAPVAYSRRDLRRYVHRVRDRIELRPHSAQLRPEADRLVVVRGRDGIDVQGAVLLHQAAHAVVTPGAARVLAIPRHHVTPAITVAKLRREFPSYITVDRARFQLRVYHDLQPVRTYTIAVGQVGLETPAGVYHIQDKQVDPAWHVPNSAWAGSLAGQVIPPGPDDPLKARWMGIFNGAGIHGTDNLASLGSAASHGCIRMSIPDVIDLYDRVDVGTPIYIG